jgi:hypothetical protein
MQNFKSKPTHSILTIGGFFIEAGAHNGEDLSNTLFLEVRQPFQYNM